MGVLMNKKAGLQPTPLTPTHPPGTGVYTPMQLYRRLLAYSLACWPLLAVSLCALLVAAATEPLFAALMKP
jgi:subfamily B ATP-binding cassette protein MsbA